MERRKDDILAEVRMQVIRVYEYAQKRRSSESEGKERWWCYLELNVLWKERGVCVLVGSVG